MAGLIRILIASYLMYGATSFQTSLLSQRSLITSSRMTTTTRANARKTNLYADSQVIEIERSESDVSTFNTKAIIPSERWDFADDIFLITTTAKDSARLERTKEQLEKVNMMKKVKIRTFQPDDEDRVRGEILMSCYSLLLSSTILHYTLLFSIIVFYYSVLSSSTILYYFSLPFSIIILHYYFLLFMSYYFLLLSTTILYYYSELQCWYMSHILKEFPLFFPLLFPFLF